MKPAGPFIFTAFCVLLLKFVKKTSQVPMSVSSFIFLYFPCFCATPCAPFACVILLAPTVVPSSVPIPSTQAQSSGIPTPEKALQIQIRVRLHPHWIIAIGWAPHAGTRPFIHWQRADVSFGHTHNIPLGMWRISAYMLMPGMSAWLLIYIDIYTTRRSVDCVACWWVFVSFRFVLLPVGNLVFNIKGVGMAKKDIYIHRQYWNDKCVNPGQDSDKSLPKSVGRFMTRPLKGPKSQSRQWNGNLSPHNKMKKRTY